MNSYIHNRPMLCKRRDIGIELLDLTIDYKDQKLIDVVSTRYRELAPSLRK